MLRNNSVQAGQFYGAFYFEQGAQAQVHESKPLAFGPPTVTLSDVECYRLSSGQDLRTKIRQYTAGLRGKMSSDVEGDMAGELPRFELPEVVHAYKLPGFFAQAPSFSRPWQRITAATWQNGLRKGFALARSLRNGVTATT
jgi:hypothetical protein